MVDRRSELRDGDDGIRRHVIHDSLVNSLKRRSAHFREADGEQNPERKMEARQTDDTDRCLPKQSCTIFLSLSALPAAANPADRGVCCPTESYSIYFLLPF